MYSAHDTLAGQALNERRLFLGCAADMPDETDVAVDGDCLEGLTEGLRSSNFDDVVDAYAAGGEVQSFGAPVGVGFVVDDVVGAVAFEDLGFGFGGSCRDDAGAGSFGELVSIVSIVFSE